MIRNYLLIAVRNLLNHKTFSVINIAGLSIGIACCVLLTMYIKEELSFERHFPDADRIYRLTTTIVQDDGTSIHIQRTSPPITMTLLDELPDIASATRIVNPPEVDQHLIRYNDKTFYEKKGYLVDSTFFDVFPYELSEGDPNTALDAPSTVVISRALARKLFDDNSALDKLISITSGFSVDTFRITGVLKPTSKKSHVDADFYMSLNSKGWGEYINSLSSWATNNFVFGYIKLKPNTLAKDVEAKLPVLIEKHGGEDLHAFKRSKTMALQPLTDVHLYSSHFDYNVDLAETGNVQYVYVLASVALLILLIACINFMNLTTAKASQRAGEVGIRKTMGAGRSALIKQFLGESMIIVFLAMLVSLGLVQLALPMFTHLTERTFDLSWENWITLILSLAGISVVTGFIAGSYPAFFLSSFQPAQVLKNKQASAGGVAILRKGLVVFQFVIAITLISSILVIQKQLDFIQNKPLGFSPDYEIMVPLRTSEAREQYDALKHQLSQISGVKQVSATTSLPSTSLLRDFMLYKEGASMESAIMHYIVNVDEEYFNQLEIPILAGRDFNYETDKAGRADSKIIVNREVLVQHSIPLEKAIGSQLYLDLNGQRYAFEIIGVVENFHHHSMHQDIAPIVFFIPEDRNGFNYITFSVQAGTHKDVVSQLEKSWKSLIETTPFEIDFLSDSVKRQYESDKKVATIIAIFTTIAIVLSCLGLYGLSLYVAERKVKEIGIRKVLGASVPAIVSLLSKDFVKLVIIAFVLAVPVSYYAANQWLATFAYGIDVGISIYVTAGIASFIIAWITVGFESVKAALGNPVNSLRRE